MIFLLFLHLGQPHWLVMIMTWISTISYDDADGVLKKL